MESEKNDTNEPIYKTETDIKKKNLIVKKGKDNEKG